MVETIIVAAIIAAAAAYLWYRYTKSPGCGCGSHSCGRQDKRAATSRDCGKQ